MTGPELDERLRSTDARLDRLEATLDEEREAPARAIPDASAAERHVLFVPSAAGYELVEREGPPPSRGEEVELASSEARYEVVKIAGSPLPDDRRPCAYLELT